ncbi:MAG: hypothetical protein IJH12_05705 [Clostridia bacterium]|nr:hypothetical protein [Clostridia bacterium]
MKRKAIRNIVVFMMSVVVLITDTGCSKEQNEKKIATTSMQAEEIHTTATETSTMETVEETTISTENVTEQNSELETEAETEEIPTQEEGHRNYHIPEEGDEVLGLRMKVYSMAFDMKKSSNVSFIDAMYEIMSDEEKRPNGIGTAVVFNEVYDIQELADCFFKYNMAFVCQTAEGNYVVLTGWDEETGTICYLDDGTEMENEKSAQAEMLGNTVKVYWPEI